MSQLQQLKQQIASIGEAANKTATGLQSFNSQFSQQISGVTAAIGGSAQQKDKEIIASLQKASQEVRQAAQALAQASKVAKQYGASL